MWKCIPTAHHLQAGSRHQGWLEKIAWDFTGLLPLQQVVFVKGLRNDFIDLAFSDIHNGPVGAHPVYRFPTYAVFLKGVHEGRETQVFEDH